MRKNNQLPVSTSDPSIPFGFENNMKCEVSTVVELSVPPSFIEGRYTFVLGISLSLLSVDL
jgi:hypothetical protein